MSQQQNNGEPVMRRYVAVLLFVFAVCYQVEHPCLLRLARRSLLLRLHHLHFEPWPCANSQLHFFCRFLSISIFLYHPTAPAMAFYHARIVWSCRDPGPTVVCVGAPVRPHPGLKIGHCTCSPMSTFIDSRTFFLIIWCKIVYLHHLSLHTHYFLAAFAFCSACATPRSCACAPG